jgi:hypothetical protein
MTSHKKKSMIKKIQIPHALRVCRGDDLCQKNPFSPLSIFARDIKLTIPPQKKPVGDKPDWL